jgi:hypothetical protein
MQHAYSSFSLRFSLIGLREDAIRGGLLPLGPADGAEQRIHGRAARELPFALP